jgi:hypothetical protein
MDTVSFFKNAFVLLKKHPKLFLPKLILAGLFGIGMVATAQLTIATLAATQGYPYLLLPAVTLLGYSLGLLILDSLVNAMYPVLVKQYAEKRPLSFQHAWEHAIHKAKTIVPATMGVLVLFSLIVLPFEFLFLNAIQNGVNATAIFPGIALLLVLFVFAMLFYWFYPVVSLEQKNSAQSIIRTIQLSRNHAKTIAIASFFPFLVSLINLALAFFIDIWGVLAVFILLRFVTAVVYTYHMVLNPTLYLTNHPQNK